MGDMESMSENVKRAWTVPLPEGFDLKEFAVGVLEIAKENLKGDGHLIPTAFAITASHIHCYSVSFANHEEKPLAYSKLIEAASEQGATALITCNDALIGDKAGPDAIEAYYPGKLAAEQAKECIMLVVSGPAIQTWSADIPYERNNNGIEFGDALEQIGCEVGFLEGWAASETPKVQ
jgi:hypothetical protein